MQVDNMADSCQFFTAGVDFIKLCDMMIVFKTAFSAGRTERYMHNAISIILGTIAIYLALFFHVAFKPKISRKLIGGAAVAALVVGLVFYGICFASISDNTVLAVLNTCSAVCKLFVGEGSAGAIAASPLMEYVLVQIIFSTLSFLGIFATTGAAVSAIGAGFLRQLRLRLQRKKELAVITPLNANTLAFARALTQTNRTAVVFVDKAPSPDSMSAAVSMGCVVRSDAAALSPDTAFLRSIGAAKGERKIRLYALSTDRYQNRKYAEDFLQALQQRQILPAQTGLTVFAEEDATEVSFCAGAYHFGTVLCVNEEFLAARMLMKKAPPYDTVTFDAAGKATADFHALVVGSGKVGQAVIKQLVMNAQFPGSEFRLTVFDPVFDAITGRFRYECGQLFETYRIDIHNADARSRQMYEYLSANWQTLRYIVVCSGSDDTNREISRQIGHFLAMRGCELPLYICSTRGLQKITSRDVKRWDIFTPQVLCSDEIDRKAQLLNHAYCGNDRTPQENWADCDYFSRMSSRASADFAPAFLKMAGLGTDAVPEGSWVSGELLENMAICEHERWCAFHYCMGFRAMTKEEFESRCQTYLAEKAKDPTTRYRIGKDLRARIHCCLIPWEELDDLSARENAVTGKNTDYKQMDRNNVLTLPQLLKG